MAEEIKKTETEKGKTKEDNIKEKAVEKFVEFTIPLGKGFRQTVRYKKTPKAIKLIKKFLARHMKIYDRNLKKIKLDKYLNEFIWSRGIRNPPSKIRVKVVRDGEIVRSRTCRDARKIKIQKGKT